MSAIPLSSKFRRARAGVTPMEMGIVLGIIAIIIGGVAGVRELRLQSQTNETNRDLSVIAVAVVRQASQLNTYGTSAINQAALIRAGGITGKIVDTTTNTLVNRFGGTYTITGAGTTQFYVDHPNTSANLCIRLMESANSDAGWTAVRVGTTGTDRATPVSETTANTDCSADGLTLRYTYTGR